jgi:glycosyltransferase involved in cell wall biosynthesis
MKLSVVWCTLVIIFVPLSFSQTYTKGPRVSVVISLFKADAYLPYFIQDLVRQTIFDECEFIFINANSPGNEAEILRPYLKKYSNFVYIKLDHDPGLYGVWNLGIKMAKSDIVANANVDDFFAINFLEVHEKVLCDHAQIGFVFSSFTLTDQPNQKFERHAFFKQVDMLLFELKPGVYIETNNNHSVWRKSLHEQYGYFDESFKVLGDVDFYTRLIEGGVKIKKLPGVYGSLYINPSGITSNAGRSGLAEYEINLWRRKHASLQASYLIQDSARINSNNIMVIS